ncbi:RNA-binding protein [archaeon]|nr:MAG: RNA-binding protein [archaeon]
MSSLNGYQPVREVRLIHHRDGECKGFAFVQFHTIQQAEGVVHTYGQYICMFVCMSM